MKAYTIVVGERYTYFISTLYKHIENDKIEVGTLSGLLDSGLRGSLKNTNNNLDAFAYNLQKCCDGIYSNSYLLPKPRRR